MHHVALILATTVAQAADITQNWWYSLAAAIPPMVWGSVELVRRLKGKKGEGKADTPNHPPVEGKADTPNHPPVERRKGHRDMQKELDRQSTITQSLRKDVVRVEKKVDGIDEKFDRAQERMTEYHGKVERTLGWIEAQKGK